MIKVLIAGSPDYRDAAHVEKTLNGMCAFYGELMLIHGNDGGASGLAAGWAGRAGVVQARVPALWGLRTDPDNAVRTRAMLALRPDVCVVFGRDEWSVAASARAAGIDTYEV